jgi:CheY-like chemotaxis protein
VSKKVLEMVTDHVYKPPPSALHFAPGLPPRVDALLQEMLRKRPEDRPNALELRIRLEELRAEGEAPPSREARAIEKRQRIDAPAFLPSQPPTQPLGAPKSEPSAIIGVLSPLDRECEIALATKGIAIRSLSSWSDPLDGLAAVFAPEANASQVVQLSKGGPPVLAGTVAGDMSRIAELLRAGAADVVSLPVQADELLRKLARAMKRYQAQKKS